MPDATKVSTGKPKVSGAVFRAPLGTALPTAADGQLNAAFKELGYVSDDGVTNNNTPETDSIKAWGGQSVLVVTNEKKDEWSLTLIESMRPDVLKTVYGDDNVTQDAETQAITLTANANAVPEASYVIDMQLKGGALKRIVIPCGALSEVGEIAYKDDEAIGYEITINALPDSSGATHREYIKLPTTTTEGSDE